MNFFDDEKSSATNASTTPDGGSAGNAERLSSPRDSDGKSAPEGCAIACPVCGGHLIEIRAKLQCERCHTICETCCEGGRWE